MTTPPFVHKTILIHAPVSAVWKALTDNKLLEAWMSDENLKINSDWKEGSMVEMFSKANGEHAYRGIVLKSETEKSLCYSSFADVSNLPDKPENYSVVTFSLQNEGNSTTLTLDHSNLIAIAAYEHSNFYWASSLQVLKQLLEST